MAATLKVEAAAEEGEVTSMTHDGRGVSQAGGKAVFIEGALPGERVSFRRYRRRRRHDEARVLEVLRAAPGRVEPRCAHFGTCGGCALQHLEPGQQLERKRLQVAEELQRIGKVSPARWLPSLAGPAWNYRRRARLGVKYVHKKGRVLVGFRERASPFIAELQRCEVLAAPVGAMIGELAALFNQLTIRDRLPQVEVAVAATATALVLRVLAPPSDADLEMLRQFAREHGVDFYLQPGGLDTVAPLHPPARELSYPLPGLPAGLLFEPTDFLQVNGRINEKLVELAIELLDPQAGDRAVDLFCGLGNFSLPLARRAGTVVGIEGDAGLVGRARDNAARNGIANARFVAADLFQPPADAGWLAGGIDLVLLDPPRAGAAEVLPLVVAAGPRRIVYVSCHPATLARDAGMLVHGHGWQLVAAGVIDMFPHTAHVESIAVLEPAA